MLISEDYLKKKDKGVIDQFTLTESEDEITSLEDYVKEKHLRYHFKFGVVNQYEIEFENEAGSPKSTVPIGTEQVSQVAHENVDCATVVDEQVETPVQGDALLGEQVIVIYIDVAKHSLVVCNPFIDETDAPESVARGVGFGVRVSFSIEVSIVGVCKWGVPWLCSVDGCPRDSSEAIRLEVRNYISGEASLV
ncbi:hypothetical protein K7X08_012115 [Anisodus acutangulus]|uniref:Uncharacterized protein n=1 Tax=Anisodus acutangulus TaxID=402998 RepID=A0A9Q1QYC4_9SOLA|nr:hypothetical protein K7X08_012115 [Anisodus acutangulus]